MGNKKNIKIIVLIIAIAVVLLGTSAGVMYAFGVFSSDKAKAFELLQQAPQKMMYSSTGNYIGSTEMTKGMLEHGMDMNFKYSNLSMDGFPGQREEVLSIISKMEIDFGLQLDMENQKGRINIGAGTNGSNINVQAYASLADKKVAIAVPELLNNKVFTLTASEEAGQKQIQKVQDVLKQISELKDSFKEHIESQGAVIYEGATCEKIDKGYRLTIPKDVTNDVINSLQKYVEEQKSGVEAIEELLGAEKGSVSSKLKEFLPKLTEDTGDFVFDVYGERNQLTGLKVSMKDGAGVEVTFDVTFAENKSQSSMNIAIVAKEGTKSLGKFEFSRNSTESDRCEDNISYKVTNGEDEVLSCQSAVTLNKETKEMTMTGSSQNEDAKSQVSAKGSIKNLNKGKCVTYQLDEMEVKTNTSLGEQKFTCSAELTQGVLDGEVTAPKGEEIAINSQTMKTFSANYGREATLSFLSILAQWGVDLEKLYQSRAMANGIMGGTDDDAIDDSGVGFGNGDAEDDTDIGLGNQDAADGDSGDGTESDGETSGETTDAISGFLS